MKKIFLTISVLLFYSQIQAQTEHPFPDSNAVWSYYRQYGHEPGPPMSYKWLTEHYAIFFGKDTTVNEKEYKKLFFYQTRTIGYDSTTKGVIRIEGDKVLYNPLPYWGGTDTNEFLLYDFGIELYDSIKIRLQWDDTVTLTCQGIDSILINDQYRKRWYIEFIESGFYNYWIEGIGSDYHFLSSYEPFFSADFDLFDFMCFEQDSFLYQLYDSCHMKGQFPDIVFEPSQPNNKISVFPNPVKDKSIINFSTNDAKEAEVQIYSTKGQLLKTYRSGNQELVIYNKNYEKGIYFVKAIADSRVFTTKFIIH